MSTKSAETKQFIIETVAPMFNKLGYSATSLSDITKATGLTKGAVYGNFLNKEEIALEAFNYNMKYLIKVISKKINDESSPVKKLYAFTNFFRGYYTVFSEFGGCPILNVGVDSKNQNPELYKRVKYSINTIINYLSEIIKAGILQNEMKHNINPKKYASLFFSLIEGSVFMMSTFNDESYMHNMIEHVNKIIKKEIEN